MAIQKSITGRIPVAERCLQMHFLGLALCNKPEEETGYEEQQFLNIQTKKERNTCRKGVGH